MWNQNKKIILFFVIFLIILSVVLLFSKNNKNLINESESAEVQKTVEGLENLLENGINSENVSSLFNYFLPDSIEQDKIYRNAILSNIQTKKEQLNFKIVGYEILSSQKNENGKNYQVLVQEVRDYKEKNNDYGSKFSRIFVLENVNDEWKIKEYKKINNNNSYSGNLSGSRKYDGFYP